MNEFKNNLLFRLFKYPWLIVFVIGIITVFFALQLPKAELDNNNIRFMPEDDEALLTSQYIDDTFGSSVFILIALERNYGDVFDPAFLNRIGEFNQRIESFEITGNINSIVSSDYIFAEGKSAEESSIVTGKLLDADFSGTGAEIAELKQKILSWDIYRLALVSDDFKATQILVPLAITDEMASRPEVIDSFTEIRDIAKEMFSGYAEVYVTGIPVISATINEAMRTDLMTMIPLVVLVVLVVLFFSFRSFMPVALPLVTVLTAVIWSLGAMPLLGIKLSVISTVLPVILVAVGSAYGIHVVTHYLEDTEGKAEITSGEHFEIVLSVLKKIGKAVFLAAVTTLAGFASFCFTDVLPIREFGFFSTFGVLVSFIVSLALIPALLLIRGPKKLKKPAKSGTFDSADKTAENDGGIARLFTVIAGKKKTVLFAAALVVIVSVWGVSKVIVDNVFVEYFKTSTDIYRSDRFIREKFGGSKIVSVVAEAETTERLLMPDVLGAMDNLASYLETNVAEVGKVMGFTDLVKRINQVFNADESPEGIKPAAIVSDTGAFGFDSFGFGDTGFAGTEYSAAGTEEIAGEAASGGDNASAENRESITAAEMISFLRTAASSGKTRSISANELVRELEKLINYEGASYYEIPSSPERYGKTSAEELSLLVANYLVLLSGSIDSYANDPLAPTAIKTTVQLRTLGDEDTGRAVNSIRGFIAENFPPDVKTTIGGTALVESALTRLVVKSQLTSVILSVFAVFIIIALSNRSLTAGFVGIAPLSISILVNFAVMGLVGIKLNMGTSMVASVSVGIGIDYTIHYIEAYKREFAASGGKGNFLLKTFAASGRAILVNAVSVGAGFAVLLFSQFIMLKDLGLLIAITMAVSAVVSLTVIPVLLLIIKPRFVQNGLK